MDNLRRNTDQWQRLKKSGLNVYFMLLKKKRKEKK